MKTKIDLTAFRLELRMAIYKALIKNKESVKDLSWFCKEEEDATKMADES